MTRGHALNHRDLRGFPKPVADKILHVVNAHACRARLIDGRHVFLYGPNGDTKKISSARKAPDSIRHLTSFVGCDHS